MTYPVSVVIPTIGCREKFLTDECLPLVYVNDPNEVIVVTDPGNGSKKRNIGLAKATSPYVLFVDDDSILRPGCIAKMVKALEKAPWMSFVYSDYERFSVKGIESLAPSGYFSAGLFDAKRLRSGNYINTTSLIRREVCPKWDETLERFQDWDFWLSVVLAGGAGCYIPEALYELWQIDASVSNTVKANPYIEMIVAKHKLNL